MTRKGENIYKRKDGRWEGRYIKSTNPFEKRKYGYIYGRSYAEVKSKLNKAKAISNTEGDLKNSIIVTYDKVLNLWLQAIKLKVKESTYSKYTHLVERHIKKSLGHISINQLNSKIVGNYISILLSNGRIDGNGGLSTKTVNDILTIIKSSIEYAQQCNFCITCDLSRLFVKKEEKEIRVLTHSEQKKLVRFLTTDMTSCKLGILISLYTGMRIGEICALRWEDIHLDERIIKIRRTMQRIQNYDNERGAKTKIIFTSPKTKNSIRDIPIPKWFVKHLRKFECSGKSYVLTGNENRFMEPRTLQNHFKKYANEIGINQINYHVLRHTFATRCIELDFDIKTLSEILGHSNVNITLNRYVHPSLELKIENMNKLLPPI